MSFLLLALLTGGAGLRYPLLGLTIHLVAIALLAQAAHDRLWVKLGLSARLIIASFIAAIFLALAQLVPLPPSIWSALPGRETAAVLDAGLGWERWRPLSLTPDLTVRFALALLPPLAAFVLFLRSGNEARLLLIRLIVLAAIFGALLAFLQVAMGEHAPVLFQTTHRGWGVGLFVNRNHHAVLLLIAILLTATPGLVPNPTARRGRQRSSESDQLGWVVPMIVAAILSLGVLATGSRTALVLLPFCLLVAAGALVHERKLTRWFVLAALLYIIVGAVVGQSDASRQVLERFAWLADDLRFQYWDNSLYATATMMPWGSGFGSFGTVYPMVEPLAQVGQLRVNHAHNDLLEFVLEGGVPAILCLLIASFAVGFAILNGFRARSSTRTMTLIAASGLGVALVFSLVDFPLRMDAIACLAAGLLGLLCVPLDCPPESSAKGSHRRLAFLMLPPVCVLGAVCVTTMVGEAALQRDRADIATAIAPWSAAAWEARASNAQVQGDHTQSRRLAARALAIAPLNAAAVRAIAMADLQIGASERGRELLLAGAALGWRDPIHQLWLAEAAIAAGNPVVAAERIDALLRRDLFSAELIEEIVRLVASPGGVEAVAARLADRPGWRQGFLNALAKELPSNQTTVLSLLRELRARGVPVTSGEAALMRWRAQEAGDSALVRALWIASGEPGLLGAGGFEKLVTPLPVASAPYSWAAPAVPGVRVGLVEDAGRNGDALSINSSGISGGEVLTQRVALAPGSYAIEFSARYVRKGGNAEHPEWRISCADGADLKTIGITDHGSGTAGWLFFRDQFEVPAECGAQKLALLLPSAEQTGQTLMLDDLSLRRLHRNIGGDKVSTKP